MYSCEGEIKQNALYIKNCKSKKKKQLDENWVDLYTSHKIKSTKTKTKQKRNSTS